MTHIALYQCQQMELSVVMEMFYLCCPVWSPHKATTI